MDRKTNLREMNAPDVDSGKFAGDTILANTANKTAAEKEGNALEEYTTPAQPKSELGGKNEFK